MKIARVPADKRLQEEIADGGIGIDDVDADRSEPRRIYLKTAFTRGSLTTGAVRENARSPPKIFAGVTQSVVGRFIQLVTLTFAISRPPKGSERPPPMLPE